MVHNLTDLCGKSTRKIDEAFEEKEVTTLVQMKRERDILYWKLEQLDRDIYAFENYDPEDVG
tara:strand:+ start:1709 stop:1894 length:186 start_codon:yes stop_codon:yes gene_type:complete